MKWMELFARKKAEVKQAKKNAPKKDVPRLIDGRPVPKPNQTKIFRKGIF